MRAKGLQESWELLARKKKRMLNEDSTKEDVNLVQRRSGTVCNGFHSQKEEKALVPHILVITD